MVPRRANHRRRSVEAGNHVSRSSHATAALFAPGRPERIGDRRDTWFGAFDFGDGIKAPLIAPHNGEEYFRDRANRVFGALEKILDPARCTVLDVGCADGYFAVEAARRGYRDVLGVDVRTDAIERARFAARVLGVSGAEFKVGNVYELDRCCDRKYDLVLCQGLFYHLADPARGMRQVHGVTGRVALFAGWTVIRPDPVFYVRSEEVADIRNGDVATVLVPTNAGIRRLLEIIGYSPIRDLVERNDVMDWTSNQGDWRELLAWVPADQASRQRLP
jgi:SAM-dependent methyltransferase